MWLFDFFPWKNFLKTIIAKLKVRFSDSLVEQSLNELYNAGKLKQDETVRISFAYLFRIQCEGKYFLVPNTRSGKMQPVGGVYKMTPRELRYLQKNYSVRGDKNIEVDSVTEYDYRLHVRAEHLLEFIEKFDNTKRRERFDDIKNGGVTREFYEELIVTGIVDPTIFQTITYEYVGRDVKKVAFSEYFGCYELLLADIFEIILTEKQAEELQKLKRIESSKYLFASREDIRKCRTKAMRGDIAPHSYKVLISNQNQLSNFRHYANHTITVSMNIDR